MEPGQVIHLCRQTDAHASQKIILLKTGALELVQLIVPAGQGIPTYAAQGEIVIQCLEGRIAVTALGEVHELGPHELLYFETDEPFSIRAHETASLLCTLLQPLSSALPSTIG